MAVIVRVNCLPVLRIRGVTSRKLFIPLGFLVPSASELYGWASE